MPEIDLNTEGLHHNPDDDEHGRRMGRDLVLLDSETPVTDVAREVRQEADRSGTLPNLDGFAEATNE